MPIAVTNEATVMYTGQYFWIWLNGADLTTTSRQFVIICLESSPTIFVYDLRIMIICSIYLNHLLFIVNMLQHATILVSKAILVGGLEHFLFSHILRIIIPID